MDVESFAMGNSQKTLCAKQDDKNTDDEDTDVLEELFSDRPFHGKAGLQMMASHRIALHTHDRSALVLFAKEIACTVC